ARARAADRRRRVEDRPGAGRHPRLRRPAPGGQPRAARPRRPAFGRLDRRPGPHARRTQPRTRPRVAPHPAPPHRTRARTQPRPQPRTLTNETAPAYSNSENDGKRDADAPQVQTASTLLYGVAGGKARATRTS